MKLRCPVCHSSNSLDAYASDEAGRELLATLAGTGPLFRPLVHYLGLFRAQSRDLSNSRALKLVGEVLELEADPHQLAVAMHQTVEAIHTKRLAGDDRPLKNHNYLKQVLATVAIAPPSMAIATNGSQGERLSKRKQSIKDLGTWAGDNWLRQEITIGLATLLGVGREGAPAADMIIITAGLWEKHLVEKNVTIEEVDKHRIKQAFKDLENYDKWPEPKDLYARLPRRPERDRVSHNLSDDDIAKGKEFFRKMTGQ